MKEFFSRELSWIEFNARVLQEAKKKEYPLLERLKFLTIVSSNFDEFFMIRVGHIKRTLKKNMRARESYTKEPLKIQLEHIAKRVHQIVEEQYSYLIEDILPQIKAEGLCYVSPKEFTPEQSYYVKQSFTHEIFPLLTPLRTGKTKEFPHIANLKLYAAFLLQPLLQETDYISAFSHKKEENPLAIVQIPTSISRVLWLPSKDRNEKAFTLIDDVISHYGTQLFPGYSVKEALLFKITRDADFAVEDATQQDFIQAMEEVLEQRQLSFPTRLVCNSSSKTIKKMLQEKLKLSNGDVYEVSNFVDLSTLTDIVDVEGFNHLKFKKWNNFYPAIFSKENDFFATIKQQDVLLNVPYESFEPVLNFINRASEDPKVLAIKMTLYRTSGNSPIVRALEKAARNGKQVTVFIEIKARFDEKQNISWVSQLERSGVIVVYSIANIKVHAKMLLVVRKETEGISRYLHLSTGNYNDKTAKIYSDLSLFTANEELAQDATLFFNMISGYSAIQTMKKIIMAPLNLKKQLLSFIEREGALSTPENPGLIIAKMNSLADKDIIQALYEASSKNVKIILNIRGICMLIPQKKGLSENITVFSIIDRYLEHSRIFYFQNAGSEEIYLSSADWMSRNLERRVEIMFPVLQKNIFMQIKDLLKTYQEDKKNSYLLQENGSWLPSETSKGKPLSAQQILYKKYEKIQEAHNKEQPLEFTVRRTSIQNHK